MVQTYTAEDPPLQSPLDGLALVVGAPPADRDQDSHDVIYFYGAEGPLGLLSNYAPAPFLMGGRRWLTAEHAYQASKFSDPAIRNRIAVAETAKDAARIGRDRSLPRRAGWNHLVKHKTMWQVQIAKFSQHAAARAVLLGTGRSRLVEHNLRCGYWGSGPDGLGANHFGRTLEATREICMSGLVALEHEGTLAGVDPDDLIARAELARWLRAQPDQALARLRHLEPMVGCPVACSFCAQNARARVHALDLRALSNLVAALKLVGLETAARQHRDDGSPRLDPEQAHLVDGVFARDFLMPADGLVAFARDEHRPGVIYPYLDADPLLYPHIATFAELVHRELGVRTRISTVGIAGTADGRRCLAQLAVIPHALAGIRLSVTTYPQTVVADLREGGTGAVYFDDLAITLAGLRPAFDALGFGARRACCELRFRPHVVAAAVEEEFVEGHHVLRTGPWLLVALRPGGVPQTAHLVSSNGSLPELDLSPAPYLRVRGHHEVDPISLVRGVSRDVVDEVGLHRLANEDGAYYGVDVVGDELGERQLYIYPATCRRQGGYLDGERYFLNALLHHKRDRGIGRRELFEAAVWEDVDDVLASLESRASALVNQDPAAASHLRREVLILVRGYARALRAAGFPPSAFFDRNFTRDTGFTCNMGRGHGDYRAIASRKNLPVTVQHERSFGGASTLAAEGVITRLAIDSRRLVTLQMPNGERRGSLVLETRDLAATTHEHGQVMASSSFRIDGVEELHELPIPGERRWAR